MSDDLEDRSFWKYKLGCKLIDFCSLSVRYVVWGYVAYLTFLSIEVLADKTTRINIYHSVVIDLLSKSWGSRPWPWWVLTMAFLLWAFLERSGRKRKTAKLTGRITELETIIDPNRSSSGLSPTGDHPSNE